MPKNDKNKAAPMPLGKAIRQAGEGTITKPELKGILDSAKSSGQFVQKLDTINQNLKEKDRAGIGLGSGASNMLIRQASKQSPTGYDAYLSMVSGKPTLGTGRLGTEIQRRATEFGTTGSMGSLVPRGMSTMPSGRLTLPGVGPQFTYGGGGGKGPYDETNMPFTTPTPGVGPGPWAPGKTEGGGGTNTTNTTDSLDPTKQSPLTPEGMAEASSDGMPSPFSLTGAFNWRRNKGRGKGKGNKSTAAASRAARPMPSSNKLGM